MVMKREFNTRHSGYYFGCNFLLKALNVKTQCVCDKFQYSHIARNIFRDRVRPLSVRIPAEGCGFLRAALLPLFYCAEQFRN